MQLGTKESSACSTITRGSTIVLDAKRRLVVKVGSVPITRDTLVSTAIGVKNATKASHARGIIMITWRNTKGELFLATFVTSDSKQTVV